ncbi:hypothetical protein AB0A73_10235 [Glycomyces sp. NPDC047369]
MDVAKIAEHTVELLASSATTDLWSLTKDQVARVLSRGRGERLRDLERQLDEMRAQITQATFQVGSGSRDALDADWRKRIVDVLEVYPEAADELRAVLPPDPRSTPVPAVVISGLRATGNATQIVVGSGSVTVSEQTLKPAAHRLDPGEGEDARG